MLSIARLIETLSSYRVVDLSGFKLLTGRLKLFLLLKRIRRDAVNSVLRSSVLASEKESLVLELDSGRAVCMRETIPFDITRVGCLGLIMEGTKLCSCEGGMNLATTVSCECKQDSVALG